MPLRFTTLAAPAATRPSTMADKVKKYRELRPHDRKAAFCMLVMAVENGVVKKGSKKAVADCFEVAPKTISRLWKGTLANIEFHLSNHDDVESMLKVNDLCFQGLLYDLPDAVFANGKAGKVGKKQILDREKLKELTRMTPLNQRRTFRKLAGQLNISVSTCWKLLRKERIFRSHVSRLKPMLTDGNKLHRLLWALTMVDQSTVTGTRSGWKFKDMCDSIHVDEKWFFLCFDGARYILVEDEPDPHRHTKHKNHITKVMFLCAQVRPRMDPNTNQMWDGKIGIWPIGKWTIAKNNSVNRPAGTPVWENENIDAAKCISILVDTVVPAIIRKWPRGQWNDNSFKLTIQQDGAPGHGTDEVLFQFDKAMDELAATGMLPCEDKIVLMTQPPNSPDTNVDDLGFFRALQSTYYQEAPRNAGEIISMVEAAYAECPANKINCIWLTLQSVHNEIIDCHGGNDYKLPHMNKEKLEREGRLPRILDVTNKACEIVEMMGVAPCELAELERESQEARIEAARARAAEAEASAVNQGLDTQAISLSDDETLSVTELEELDVTEASTEELEAQAMECLNSLPDFS